MSSKKDKKVTEATEMPILSESVLGKVTDESKQSRSAALKRARMDRKNERAKKNRLNQRGGGTGMKIFDSSDTSDDEQSPKQKVTKRQKKKKQRPFDKKRQNEIDQGAEVNSRVVDSKDKCCAETVHNTEIEFYDGSLQQNEQSDADKNPISMEEDRGTFAVTADGASLSLQSYPPQSGQPSSEIDRCLQRRGILKKLIDDLNLESKEKVAHDPKLKEKNLTERNWDKRMKQLDGSWNLNRMSVWNARIESYGPRPSVICSGCFTVMPTKDYICCVNCKCQFCFKCDLDTHKSKPFHKRTAFWTNESMPLKPTEFLNAQSIVVELDVAVPCNQPTRCPSCLSSELKIDCGTTKIIFVNKDGRFDLSAPLFKCTNCLNIYEATFGDFVSSGIWPGAPTRSAYLFSEDLLEFWHHLKYQCPGTSLAKFLETLGCISEVQRREKVINPTLFHRASKEYEKFLHYIDTEILKNDPMSCEVCWDDPHSCAIDGNFKLFRFDSAKEGGWTSLFGNSVIASDEDMNNHIAMVDKAVLPQKGSASCGGSVFKAARSDSSKFKGLDETGLICMCCRHGKLLGAANMYHGETYRHTLFLHDIAHKKGYKFVMNDVACHYRGWAKKVEEEISKSTGRFDGLMKDTTLLIPRMHAKAHVWYCQVLMNPHWEKGVAGTVGEELEQDFSILSRLGNSTKHMGKSNRRDHLSGGILYLNWRKSKEFPRTLALRLKNTRVYVNAYQKQLDECLLKSGKQLSEVEVIYQDLKRQAILCYEKRSTSKWPMTLHQKDLEGTYIEYGILRDAMDREAVHSKCRKKFKGQFGEVKKKAKALIDVINEQQWERTKSKKKPTADPKSKLSPVPYVTMEDFEIGVFPWQICGTTSEFSSNYNMVEIWMLLARYEEEIIQVQKEMVTYLRFISTKIDRLGKESDCHSNTEDCGGTSVKDGQPQLKRGKIFLLATEIRRMKELQQRARRTFLIALDDGYLPSEEEYEDFDGEDTSISDEESDSSKKMEDDEERNKLICPGSSSGNI